MVGRGAHPGGKYIVRDGLEDCGDGDGECPLSGFVGHGRVSVTCGEKEDGKELRGDVLSVRELNA